MGTDNVVSLLPRIKANEEQKLRAKTAAKVAAAYRIKNEVFRRLEHIRSTSKIRSKRFAYPTLHCRNATRLPPGELLILSLPSKFTGTGSPVRKFAVDMCRYHYAELKSILQADLAACQSVLDYVNEQGDAASLVSPTSIIVYMNRLVWLMDELESVVEKPAKDFCES